MIGILAFGSLIEDPGPELARVIVNRKAAQTPFNVEFARSSETRHGAPTLVPVTIGGAPVQAVILICADRVTQEEGMDMLWRRETRQIGTGKHYKLPKKPTPKGVLIRSLQSFADIDWVIYTDFYEIGKIHKPTAKELARLAIASVRNSTDKEGMEGISYLISAKRLGIVTPLMPEYESEILQQTNTPNLEAALNKLRISL